MTVGSESGALGDPADLADRLVEATSPEELYDLIGSIPDGLVDAVRERVARTAQTVGGARRELLVRIEQLLAASRPEHEPRPPLAAVGPARVSAFGLHLYGPALPGLLDTYMTVAPIEAPDFLRSNPLLLTPPAVQTIRLLASSHDPNDWSEPSPQAAARLLSLAEEFGVAYAVDRAAFGVNVPPPPLPDFELSHRIERVFRTKDADRAVALGRAALTHASIADADRATRSRAEGGLAFALLRRYRANGDVGDANEAAIHFRRSQSAARRSDGATARADATWYFVLAAGRATLDYELAEALGSQSMLVRAEFWLLRALLRLNGSEMQDWELPLTAARILIATYASSGQREDALLGIAFLHVARFSPDRREQANVRSAAQALLAHARSYGDDEVIKLGTGLPHDGEPAPLERLAADRHSLPNARLLALGAGSYGLGLEELGRSLLRNRPLADASALGELLGELSTLDGVGEALRASLLLASVSMALAGTPDVTALATLARRLADLDVAGVGPALSAELSVARGRVLAALGATAQAARVWTALLARRDIPSQTRTEAQRQLGMAAYAARNWPVVIDALRSYHRGLVQAADEDLLLVDKLRSLRRDTSTLAMLVESVLRLDGPWEAVLTLEEQRGVAARSAWARSHEDQALTTADAVRQASRHVSLCYLMSGPVAGTALLIDRGGTARALTLPGFDLASATTWAHALMAAEEEEQAGTAALEPFLNGLADDMWRGGIDRVVAALPPAERVALIPVGPLTVLPLHGAREHLANGQYRYADEAVSIEYVTSARNLAISLEKLAPASYHSALVVHSPSPSQLEPLEFAEWEARKVAGLLDAKVLAGAHATRENVLRAWGNCDILHFACHATADLDRPLASGLFLAGDYRLTVEEVLDRRGETSRQPLIVLSACQTARTDLASADESIALPAAFSSLGASGVVATMWSIDDQAAASIVARFYTALVTGGVEPAEALRWATGGMPALPGLSGWQATRNQELAPLLCDRLAFVYVRA
jgi:hypothetical protein